MTRIHMQTEAVRQVSDELVSASQQLDSLPDQVTKLSRALDAAWHGGNSNHYVHEIRHLASELEVEIQNLFQLGSQVSREVAEWENADHYGARGFQPMEWRQTRTDAWGMPISTFPLPIPRPTPARPDPQNPTGEGSYEFLPGWEGGLDVKLSSLWTDEGWKPDADASLGLKVGILGGAALDGEGSANWQIGRYDFGGLVGDYAFSQKELGGMIGMDENGFTAGIYGEYDLAQASAGAVLGGSLLGLTFSTAGSVGSVDGFVGLKTKEGAKLPTVGASVGATAASGEVGLGVNVAGANVGVSAGLSLGFEVGFELGPETKIKAGPFKIGLKFGKAIND